MVSVGTYSAWESTATLCLLSGARGAWASTGEERVRGILCLHTHSLLYLTMWNFIRFCFKRKTLEELLYLSNRRDTHEINRPFHATKNVFTEIILWQR